MVVKSRRFFFLKLKFFHCDVLHVRLMTVTSEFSSFTLPLAIVSCAIVGFFSSLLPLLIE